MRSTKTTSLLDELAVISKHLRIDEPDIIDMSWMTDDELENHVGHSLDATMVKESRKT